MPVLRGLMEERPLQSLLARGEVLAFNRRGRWDISEPQVQRSLGFKIFRGFHSYVRSLCVRVPFFPR